MILLGGDFFLSSLSSLDLGNNKVVCKNKLDGIPSTARVT